MNSLSAAGAKPVNIDLLIRPQWIIPIEPAGITLSGHSLAVSEGCIVAVLPNAAAAQRFTAQQTLDLPGQVVLPGLINLHTHAAMSLLRGYADDLPLMRWLSERIWPAEAGHATPDFVHAGTLLACAEMLRGGITTFNDMYFFPEAAAAAARRLGMRAVLGIIAIEFPTRYATDTDDYLAKGLALRDALRGDPLLDFCLAPHAPYTVADKTFEKIATLAAQLEIPIHMHVHETIHEIEESLTQHGVRPIERLRRLGLLGPQLIAVHAVHLDAGEIDLLAHEGCHLAHCPTSNLKLGSGIPPLSAIQARGLNFGLGPTVQLRTTASTCFMKCAMRPSWPKDPAATPRRWTRMQHCVQPHLAGRKRSGWMTESDRCYPARRPTCARCASTNGCCSHASTRPHTWYTSPDANRSPIPGSRASWQCATVRHRKSIFPNCLTSQVCGILG